MKRIMIKFTKFFTAAAVVSLVFASCLDDNDDDRLYGEECYGMVEGTGKSFSVKTDGGNTLNVTENLDAKFQAEDGMRVRMNFTVLEQKSDSEYDVRANGDRLGADQETCPVFRTDATADRQHRKRSDRSGERMVRSREIFERDFFDLGQQ